MERDTREIFEALTRGVEEEIAARRAREQTARRRKAPSLLLRGGVGIGVITLVGVRLPLLGAALFLALTWVLHRATEKVVPDERD